MRTWLRIFFVGGAISFRALFAWIRPSIYIPTLLLADQRSIVVLCAHGSEEFLEQRPNGARHARVNSRILPQNGSEQS